MIKEFGRRRAVASQGQARTTGFRIATYLGKSFISSSLSTIRHAFRAATPFLNFKQEGIPYKYLKLSYCSRARSLITGSIRRRALQRKGLSPSKTPPLHQPPSHLSTPQGQSSYYGGYRYDRCSLGICSSSKESCGQG
jgi:hypothetical protein